MTYSKHNTRSYFACVLQNEYGDKVLLI